MTRHSSLPALAAALLLSTAPLTASAAPAKPAHSTKAATATLSKSGSGKDRNAPKPAAAPAVPFAATPAWVVPIALPARSTKADRELLLSDRQVRYDPKGVTHYFHAARAVDTQADLEGMGTITIDYDPSYQTLHLHTLDVVRDGKRSSRRQQARIEVLQREGGLEEGLFFGTKTIAIVLDDLRIGDVVEFAYSTSGANPVFGNKVSEHVGLSGEWPINTQHFRVLIPADREVQLRQVGASAEIVDRRIGDMREISVMRTQIPKITVEPDAPDWILQTPRLLVSEYRDWQEVQRWSADLFRIDGASLAADLPELAAWTQLPGELERLEAALKFVRTEIRYFGIELGAGSHQPHPPKETLQRRFGDCKDKSLLLATLLRELGIDAAPALVSARMSKGVREVLPTPYAFDHVIVRVRLKDGKVLWIDPTRTYQRRPAHQLDKSSFGVALVAALTDQPAEQGLTELPPLTDPVEHVATVDTFTISKFGDPVSLTTASTFRGSLAEMFRSAVAAQGADKLGEAYRQRIQRVFPDSEEVGKLVFEDDAQDDRVVIRQEFKISKFGKFDGFTAHFPLIGFGLIGEPDLPRNTERTIPLALMPAPSVSRHTTVVNLPHAPKLNFGTQPAVRDAHFSFSRSVSAKDKTIRGEFTLRVLKDHVAADAVKKYADNVKAARSGYEATLSVPMTEETDVGTDRLVKAFRGAESGRQAGIVALFDAISEFRHARAQAVIDAGRVSGPALAALLAEQAIAQSRLDRTADALALLDRAILLDGQTAWLRRLRGELLTKLDKLPEALAEFAESDKLNHKGPRELYSLGHALYYSGDFAKAADTFLQDAEQNSGQHLHTLIWLALASQAAQRDEAARLRDLSAQANLDKWPGPVLKVLLGDLDASKLLASAQDQDRRQELQNLCEAHFFLGKYYAQQGDVQAARQQFEKARGTGVKMYLEYDFARKELARLGR